MEYTIYLALIAATMAIYAMIGVFRKDLPWKTRVVWFALVALVPIVGPTVFFMKRWPDEVTPG